MLSRHVDALARAGLAKHAAESTQKIATLEKQLCEATGKLTQRTITDAIKEAAQAEHMRPEAIAHAITLGNLELKLDEDDTPKTKDGGDVASFIDGLKASAPFLWQPARGAGARGSGDGALHIAGNPFDLGPGFNPTKQGQLMRSSPELARRLKGAAMKSVI